jgi:hypothetical protein
MFVAFDCSAIGTICIAQSGRSCVSRASEWVTDKERVESDPVSDWLTNRAGLEFLLELRAAEQALGE